MRRSLLTVFFLVAGASPVCALDWSVYPTDPGRLLPPLAFRQLVITATDSARVAAWFVPAQDSAGTERPGRHPAVLLLTGEEESLPDRLPLAAALAVRGYSVLALEHRGSGASRPFDAHPLALVYHEYVTDAASALDILWRRPEVDTTRIAALGESRGAVVALAAAGRRPEIRAVVAVGVPRSWKTYLESLAKSRPDKGYFVPETWERRDDPDRVIRRYNGAILFITGAEDLVTPPWMARELHDKYPRPKDLWIVDGAAHLGEHSPEHVLGGAYVDRIAAFLERELGKAPHRGWPER